MQRTLGYALSVLIFVTAALAADPGFVVHKRVSEVQFTVVATDREGRPWRQLSASDLAITDEGQAVADFQVRPVNDLPLRIGIVLDLSDSTRKTWPAVRSALTTSMQDLIRPGDQILMVTFNSKVESEEVVAEPRELSEKLAVQSGGLTALYDSLYAVCRHETFRGGETRRSALILFSDGQDNLSYRGLGDAIAQAERAGIAIYTIATHKPKVRLPGDRVLEEIAATSGGRAFVVKDHRELQGALQTIEEELRNSYLIFYRPPVEDSGYRRVSIAPRMAEGIRVRARAGYFAGP